MQQLQLGEIQIAIVYLHEKGNFDAWISTQNRDLAKAHKSIINSLSDEINVFHDSNNQDTITARLFFEKHGYTVQTKNIVVRGGIPLTNFRMTKAVSDKLM